MIFFPLKNNYNKCILPASDLGVLVFLKSLILSTELTGRVAHFLSLSKPQFAAGVDAASTARLLVLAPAARPSLRNRPFLGDGVPGALGGAGGSESPHGPSQLLPGVDMQLVNLKYFLRRADEVVVVEDTFPELWDFDNECGMICCCELVVTCNMVRLLPSYRE